MEEYTAYAESFTSPLFDYTMKNFNVKRREFCYAGSWSFTLNLKTGVLKRCYASCIHQNIFKNINKPIMDLAVGNCCGSLFCLNSSHFMSLGVIPSLDEPSYYQLRNRESSDWYNETLNDVLNSKLIENNQEYNTFRKICTNIIGKCDNVLYNSYRKLVSMRKK